MTLLISILTAVFISFSLGWFLSGRKQKNISLTLLQKQEKKSTLKVQEINNDKTVMSENFAQAKQDDIDAKGEKLNHAFLENGRTVEQISANLKEAQSIVDSAFSSLPTLCTSSRNTNEATKKSKLKIAALSKSVDSWGSSIDTLKNIQGLIDAIHDKAIQIRDVSSEANLLALNASIEAARAGEHGRGFAVVATSMRELSNKSADSTVDINTAVEKTRTEVEKIINGISESVSFLTEVSTEVSDSFADIEIEVSNIDQISQSSLSEAELSKENFQNLNTDVNTQLENVTRLLTDTLGEITGIKIEDISVSSDFTGMKIIDVRRPDEFTGKLGHIKNSELICLQDNFEHKIEQLDKTVPHLFVCRSGGRSARAARIALGHGFKQIYNMEGGMLEYCKVNGKP